MARRKIEVIQKVSSFNRSFGYSMAVSSATKLGADIPSMGDGGRSAPRRGAARRGELLALRWDCIDF
jgi:hypothetical protein